MPVVFLIAVIVVLAGVFFAATGRGGQLAYERVDHAPLDLGPVSAPDIAMVRPPRNARLVVLNPPGPPGPPSPMVAVNCASGPSRAFTVLVVLPLFESSIAIVGGVVLVAETGLRTA